jgi:hypothetical protein
LFMLSWFSDNLKASLLSDAVILSEAKDLTPGR